MAGKRRAEDTYGELRDRIYQRLRGVRNNPWLCDQITMDVMQVLQQQLQLSYAKGLREGRLQARELATRAAREDPDARYCDDPECDYCNEY